MEKEKQQSKDYAPDGIGRHVVMHVTKLKGWQDAKDLSRLLDGAVPISYSTETSLVQCYWPLPCQITSYTPAALDEMFNRAIGEFMARCDWIEFHKVRFKAATGITIAANRNFGLGETFSAMRQPEANTGLGVPPSNPN